MRIVEQLYDRIRSKVTPEISARITSQREKKHLSAIDRDSGAPEYGADIHDSMWAFSHRAAAQAKAHRNRADEPAPGMRM